MKRDPHDEQSLRVLAYQFWVERGRPIGSPEMDWKRAIEWLRRETAAPSPAPQPKSEHSLEARDAPPRENNPDKADPPPPRAGRGKKKKKATGDEKRT